MSPPVIMNVVNGLVTCSSPGKLRQKTAGSALVSRLPAQSVLSMRSQAEVRNDQYYVHRCRRTARTVEAEEGATVMETAIRNGVPGIEAECGGACSCATCHVYVAEEWEAATGQPQPMEEDMLDFAYDVRPLAPGLACRSASGSNSGSSFTPPPLGVDPEKSPCSRRSWFPSISVKSRRQARHRQGRRARRHLGRILRLIYVRAIVPVTYMEFMPPTFDEEQQGEARMPSSPSWRCRSPVAERVSAVVRLGSSTTRCWTRPKRPERISSSSAPHRPTMATYLLGSNASTIVRHAKCSVLVVG